MLHGIIVSCVDLVNKVVLIWLKIDSLDIKVY